MDDRYGSAAHERYLLECEAEDERWGPQGDRPTMAQLGGDTDYVPSAEEEDATVYCGACDEPIRAGQERAEVVFSEAIGGDFAQTHLIIHAACYDAENMDLA